MKPCAFLAKVERNGNWYCGEHDPVRINEKRSKLVKETNRVKSSSKLSRKDNGYSLLVKTVEEILNGQPEPSYVGKAGPLDGWRSWVSLTIGHHRNLVKAVKMIKSNG